MCYPPPSDSGCEERSSIDGRFECSPFRRTLGGRGSLGAALLFFLFTLPVGGPAFAQDAAPAVEDVYLVDPTGDGVHTLGSIVAVHAPVNRLDIVVTGQPRVTLTIGAATRHAEYARTFLWQGKRYLEFQYVVQASDRDDDGISIPANAITLNGGSIRDADGNDADLSHGAKPDHPKHKANGNVDPPPALDVVELQNFPPRGGDTFTLGNEIVAHVRFSKPVVVAGNPRLVLLIGDQHRFADFSWLSAARTWAGFRYTVQASDRDDDGISIPANAITLNGGSIKGANGTDADLSHAAAPDDPARRVNGGAETPAVVLNVRVTSRPLSGDTFGLGEEIRAHVRFSRPVAVSGNPRLVLKIGDQTRGADLWTLTSAGEYLQFRHFVQASDRDDDGVSVPANAIRLNRGSIRDALGRDADLTHEAVVDDPQLQVDGQLDAVPAITRVFLSTRPRQGDTFGVGETLLVGVVFSERVDVTGSPRLAIQVGTQTRQADLHLRRNTTLYFEHAVQASDVDEDGISVPADALTLEGGGSMRDADGNDADLTHDAVPDDPARKVNGASGPPTVRRVSFSRFPGSQDTFVAGESIFAVAQFTRGVQVTGTPQFTLQVGAQTRRADHLPLLRAAELLPPGNSFHLPGENESNVVFRYVVQPSDLDDDGISAPANALTLNGGSIRAVDGGRDARLSHDGLADDSRRKVDGSRSDDHAPAVLAIFAEPPVRSAYGGGDVITVRLTFNEGVTVTGAPRIALRIGAVTRFATFREIWGPSGLLFDYTVDESDRDGNGFSIDADAVDLNGGAIRDNSGNDADLDLGYRAFSDDPNYRVDGRLTPVPILPLGGVLALLFVLLGGGYGRLARRPQLRR